MSSVHRRSGTLGRRSSIAASALAAAAVVAGVLATSPAASASAGTLVNISPQNAPQTALAKSPATAALGIAVLQNDGPFLNQRWTMEQVQALGGGKIAFTFTNQQGGCLDVNGKSKASGAAVITRACDGSLSQQWIRDFSVNATFLKLENRNSGLVATADGSGSGARITQRADNGDFNQRWSIFGV
ncbi:RICIN domain-containing protein [Streptosporangium sp. NPDC023963]|uniref:RICIN domain-containing protein n=1 Tax=Streptosporangium sp. NPDC023963 TaxID=3155608 RepID=UPI003430BA1F